jgi:hypothetical protein
MIQKHLLFTFFTFDNQTQNMGEICYCLDHVHFNFIGNLISTFVTVQLLVHNTLLNLWSLILQN